MNQSKVWYGIDALRGFGMALGHQLNIKVRVAQGANPCTDGKTVYLRPPTTPLTYEEFVAECATVMHEAAHVMFRSVPVHLKVAKKHGPLVSQCFNAVLDIADETRFEAVIRSAQSFFQIQRDTMKAAFVKRLNDPNENPVWRVLAYVIFTVRDGWIHEAEALRQDPQIGGIAFDALRIANGCRYQRQYKSQTPGLRTPTAWAKLTKAALDIAKLFPPGTTVPEDGTSSGHGYGSMVGEAAPSASPQWQQAQPVKMAGEQEGEHALTLGPDRIPGGTQGGGPATQTQSGETFNAALHRTLVPILRSMALQLASSEEADGMNAVYSSGPVLADPVRVMIDGMGFGRREVEGEALHVAILLDTSGSMTGFIDDVSAVAQAFADAVAPVSQTLALFGFGGNVYPVQNYKKANANGGTPTGDAIKKGQETVAYKRGRRVMVILTDGQPDSMGHCQNECRKAIQAGTQILSIAYGQSISADRLREALPGSMVLEASSPSQLAGQLMMRMPAIISGRLV